MQLVYKYFLISKMLTLDVNIKLKLKDTCRTLVFVSIIFDKMTVECANFEKICFILSGKPKRYLFLLL